MVLEDLLKDKTTKKFEMGDIFIYLYEKQYTGSMSELRCTKDYFVVVFKLTENVTGEVCKGLKYCYSSNGYMILNSINIDYDLDRIVRYLYEREYQTN